MLTPPTSTPGGFIPPQVTTGIEVLLVRRALRPVLPDQDQSPCIGSEPPAVTASALTRRRTPTPEIGMGAAMLRAMAQSRYSIREHRGSTFTVEVREGEDVVAVPGFRYKLEADAWITDHRQSEREAARPDP